MQFFWGGAFEICAALLEYQQVLNGIPESDLQYKIVSAWCPLIVPASVLIFWGMANITIKRNLSKYASATFYVYLIHGGVWDIICKFFYLVKGKTYLADTNPTWSVLMWVFVVGIISYILAVWYKFIFTFIDRRMNITDTLTKIFKLDCI